MNLVFRKGLQRSARFRAKLLSDNLVRKNPWFNQSSSPRPDALIRFTDPDHTHARSFHPASQIRQLFPGRFKKLFAILAFGLLPCFPELMLRQILPRPLLLLPPIVLKRPSATAHPQASPRIFRTLRPAVLHKLFKQALSLVQSAANALPVLIQHKTHLLRWAHLHFAALVPVHPPRHHAAPVPVRPPRGSAFFLAFRAFAPVLRFLVFLPVHGHLFPLRCPNQYNRYRAPHTIRKRGHHFVHNLKNQD